LLDSSRQAREDLPRELEAQAGPADAGSAQGGGDALEGCIPPGPTTPLAEESDAFRGARRAGDGGAGDAE
jgi:hypothetical protein